MYQKYLKSIFGTISATVLILILSPLLLLITLIIFLVTRESPFFLQTRVGKNEVFFKIIKFRTMLDTRDENGELLPDHERIFGFGSFLRNHSLDELPQLFNILKGDMVIVGPRPWIPDQLLLFPKDYISKRCSVYPGVTGLAQIRGRNNIPFHRRVRYDIFYSENISLFLDISIMLQTILKIVYREGIHQHADALAHLHERFNPQPHHESSTKDK